MRNCKSSWNPVPSSLHCDGITFPQDIVPDGFYHSLSLLKNPPVLFPVKSSELSEHIIAIAEAGPKIPFLSVKDASDILSSLKPNVTDLYSLSAKHFLFSGETGILLFREILNLDK